MHFSVISSLLYLTVVQKFCQGLPQLAQQTTLSSPQTQTLSLTSTQSLSLPQTQSSSLLQTPLTLTTSSTQARAILVSPSGGPIFAVVDFHLVGNAVQVEVTVHGLDQSLPQVGHPYHIHTNGVGPDGNCEAAGGHLTPAGIPDSVPCNSATPRLCQEGNLSGKWGVLSGGQRDVTATFTDRSLQFTPGPAGIIGRAVVIHDSKGGRIACGNINLRSIAQV